MKKQSSSRSQRGSNKGIKGKHILQICVLLSVCIWLIYQVKYSHDKKKEFYEKDEKKSSELLLESKDGLVKLGRKDLLPIKEKEKQVEEDEDEVEEVNNGEEEKEKNSKEEEEEDDEEEDKNNKQGEEVVEEEDEVDNKHEEDEIDEQDESKIVEDTEEEKESDLNESDEKEKESNHVDEIDMTVDEAREEHYKADDASSAVSHESRVLKTEKLNETLGNSTRENDPEDATSEAKIQKDPLLKLGEAESDNSADKTAIEVKDSSNKSSISETRSNVTELRGETVNGNLTEPVLEASRLLQEPSQEHDMTEDDAPPPGSNLQTVIELEQARNESDRNITVFANITIQDESRNSTPESSLAQNITGLNTTKVQENSRSESDDEKERSNQISTEEIEEADDTSETTMLQEEREALTDPQTLPDIRIEGNEEDE